MTIDIRTMYLALGAVCFIVAGALYAIGAGRFREDGMRRWTIGWAVQGAYWVLISLHGVAWDVLSILLANVCLAASYSLIYSAIRNFQGRRCSRFMLLFPSAAMFVFISFCLLFANSMFYRTVFICVLSFIQVGAIAGVLLFEAPAAEKRPYLLTGLAFSTAGLLWLIRLGEALASGSNVSATSPTSSLISSLMVALAVVILSSMGFVLMIRGRAEHTLLAGEQRWAATLSSIGDAVIATDADGKLTFMNTVAEELTGWTLREAVSKPVSAVFNIVNEHTRETVESPVERVLRDGVVAGLANHTVLVRKDGSEVPIDDSGAPIKDGDGSATGVVLIFRDITERKLAEARVARLTRLYAMLSRVNEAIVRVRDPGVLYNEVCQTIAKEGEFPLVWIGEVKEGQVAPVASCGPAADYLKDIKVEVDGVLGRGPSGTCIREDRPVVNDDFDTNAATLPWREAALRWGFRASAAFPLHRRGEVVACLTLYGARHHDFDAEQLELLGALAADVSYALDTMEQERLRTSAEAGLQKSVKRFELLAHTAEELLQSPEPQNLVNSLCREVMEHLGCHAFFNFLAVEEEGRLKLNAYAGIPEEEARRIQWLDYGVAVCGCAAQDSCRIVAEHIPTTPDQRTELVASYGIKAYACHPLYGPDGKPMGTLSFGTRDRETFSDEDLSLMKAVADQVAVAMIRMKHEEALKKSRNELEERVKERTAELRASEEALRDAGTYNRSLIEASLDPLVTIDPEGRISDVNVATEQATGYARDELIGTDFSNYFTDPEQARTVYRMVFDRGVVRDYPLEIRHRDGHIATVLYNASVYRDAAGSVIGVFAAARDVSEQQKLEAQLRQAQKMEALGTLSGGIAHDFNNMLAAIIGFTELIMDHVPEQSREHRHARRILDAGIRGRDLVRQMLTFSRQTEQEKKPLRLSSIVKESARLLRASIPSTISIRVSVASESGVIMGDPTQISQVLMNLATNAAYAMREKGGSLDIGLSDFSISPSNVNPHGIEPGLYMKLTVTDTGAGIPRQILDRIFDPFFTTKGVGEGTGLGLSVALGIVKQAHGYITVASEPGKGSTFDVYFPKIVAERAAEGATGDETTIPVGNERILFIDDEDALVEMGEDLLAELGYEVTCRTSSREALALFRLDPSRFDLVVTDQTMPELTGIQLAAEVLAIRPGVPVILCTGFSHTATEESAKAAGVKGFVMKPLTKKEIARAVRKALDE